MEGWLWMLADPGFGDLGFPSIEDGGGGSEARMIFHRVLLLESSRMDYLRTTSHKAEI